MLFSSLAALALATVPAFAAPAATNGTVSGGGNSTTTSCTKPAVRKEWRELTKPERAEWIRAVNCLSKQPHDPRLSRTFPIGQRIPEIRKDGSYYDDLVYLHMDLNVKFRGTGLFFPWHRWYTHKFETALKEKCAFNGSQPYWDWSIDANDVQHATLWDDDPISGIGGWGDANNDYQLNAGGFKDLIVSYPSSHHIRRNYTITPYKYFNYSSVIVEPSRQANSTFTPAKLAEVVACADGDYQCVQVLAEGQQHMGGGAHSIIGGDLGGICPASGPSYCIRGAEFTPNDPLFHMHHANLDRLWATWQAKSPANADAFYGGSIQDYSQSAWWPLGLAPNATKASTLPADGLFGPHEDTIQDVMSTTNGPLCYTYSTGVKAV